MLVIKAFGNKILKFDQPNKGMSNKGIKANKLELYPTQIAVFVYNQLSSHFLKLLTLSRLTITSRSVSGLRSNFSRLLK